MPDDSEAASRSVECESPVPWTPARLLRAFLYGGPLVGIGLLWIAGGFKLPSSQPIAYIFICFGVCYAFSGLCIFTRWSWAPAAAILAWAAAALVFPLGILSPLMPASFSGVVATPLIFVWAAIAIFGLLKWNPPVRSLAAERDELGSARLVTTLFCEEFGAHSKKDGTPLSLRSDLRVPAGRLSQFLQNLRLDYRLSISEADAPAIDSLVDLLSLLKQREQQP